MTRKFRHLKAVLLAVLIVIGLGLHHDRANAETLTVAGGGAGILTNAGYHRFYRVMLRPVKALRGDFSLVAGTMLALSLALTLGDSHARSLPRPPHATNL